MKTFLHAALAIEVTQKLQHGQLKQTAGVLASRSFSGKADVGNLFSNFDAGQDRAAHATTMLLTEVIDRLGERSGFRAYMYCSEACIHHPLFHVLMDPCV